jgi:hypothetical protein
MEEKLVFPEVIERSVLWGTMPKARRADQYKAIVDARTGTLFAIVSQDYRVIRHEEAIDRLEDAIERFGAMGTYLTETSFYRDGARMRRICRFVEVAVEIRPRDTVNPELQLFNSYDASWPFIVILGAFRVICANGLVIGQEYFHIHRRHVSPLERIRLKEQVETALERFQTQSGQWRTWVDIALTEKVYREVMKRMGFGVKARGEIDRPPASLVLIWAFWS